MNHKKIIKLNHAARMFGVPVGWLKEQVEQGKIPAVHAGRIYLVKPKNVEAFLLRQAEAERVLQNRRKTVLGRSGCV